MKKILSVNMIAGINLDQDEKSWLDVKKKK